MSEEHRNRNFLRLVETANLAIAPAIEAKGFSRLAEEPFCFTRQPTTGVIQTIKIVDDGYYKGRVQVFSTLPCFGTTDAQVEQPELQEGSGAILDCGHLDVVIPDWESETTFKKYLSAISADLEAEIFPFLDTHNDTKSVVSGLSPELKDFYTERGVLTLSGELCPTNDYQLAKKLRNERLRSALAAFWEPLFRWSVMFLIFHALLAVEYTILEWNKSVARWNNPTTDAFMDNAALAIAACILAKYAQLISASLHWKTTANCLLWVYRAFAASTILYGLYVILMPLVEIVRKILGF